MPFNGKGEWYTGTPIDVGGNLYKGAQARAAMTENALNQQKMGEVQKNEQAVNMYNRLSQNAEQGGTAFDREGVMGDFQGSMTAQGEGIRGQQVASAIDAPRQQELKRLAGSLLFTESSDEFKQGANMLYGRLNAEEKQKFGTPDKWSRAGIGSLLDLKDSVDIYEAVSGRQRAKAMAVKGTGKGGSKTAFVQIADWLQNNMTRTDPATGKPRKLKPSEVQFEAQKIMSTGKFNAQAAATQLRKSGMSQARITEFMDFAGGLDQDQQEQPNPAGGAGAATNQPPKGAVDTGRKSGGKPVWKLPNGDFWIQASAEPINLAMNAEDVSIGTGLADQAKTAIQLRKELNDAYLNDDVARIKEIETLIQQMNNQQSNVG
jgi:hypothetical protein